MAIRCERKSTSSIRKSKKKKGGKPGQSPLFTSPCKPIQDAPRAFEFSKALLFFPKLPRMRNHAAARPARRMLDVQHLVKQNIFHGARWNARPIHAAIQQNLIGPGIVTTELASPAPGAPSNV